ncbi:MAG: tripartite tricarboxylate transporter substrate-binding protein [Xanthomonadales bacterium]|nr:tripartite tricarboxylate transporter substrate-binding protein [Xanthomonadales bacterium]
MIVGFTGERQSQMLSRSNGGPLAAIAKVLRVMSILAMATGASGCVEPDDDEAGLDLGRIHILIPGGAGGGWDTTARAVGEGLRQSGLVTGVSYENRSGGGGGVAIAHLIETGERQKNTIMVGSAALVVRSLNGLLPQGIGDLVPVASVVSDYGALVVRGDSPYRSYHAFVEAAAARPGSTMVAGGSVRGGMDHLVVQQIMLASGQNPDTLTYVAYDAGGQAMTSLLSGETQALSTGVSEVVAAHTQGQVTILAITAPRRLAELPDVPTFRELGVDALFANWRGFFGPPQMTLDDRDRIASLITDLVGRPEWEVQRSRLALTNHLRFGEDFVTFLETNRAQMMQIVSAARGPGVEVRE